MPALYKGLMGFKPTKGTVSARGVFPACLHQDCVSFLALSTEDVERVWKVCKGFDTEDIFAKRYVASSLVAKSQKCPHPSNFRSGFLLMAHWRLVVLSIVDNLLKVETLQQAGGKLVDLAWDPFEAANTLLYDSSFVLERLTILQKVGWKSIKNFYTL